MDVSQGCHHSLMLFTHKLSFLSKLQGLSGLASAVIQTVDDKDKQGRSWKKAGRERVSGCMCLSYREAEICGHEGVRKERRIHRSMKRWMTGEDKPCFPKQITAWSASIFHILKTCSLANWFKLCSKPLFSCKKNLVSFRVIFLFFYEIHVLLKLDFWNLKPKTCMVVAFLSAPEKFTFGRCKSDEHPFIISYPSGNVFTRRVLY